MAHEWDHFPEDVREQLFVVRRFDGSERWVLPRTGERPGALQCGACRVVGGTTFEEWERQVGRVAAELGRWKKLVLARRVELLFEEPPCVWGLLERLQEQTEGCHHFVWQEGERALIGASPEQLYRREGDWVETEALAGTPLDGEVSQQLIEENEWVYRHLLEVMGSCCEKVEAEQLELSRGAWRHLRRGMRGRLRVAERELWERIQPTPAVCSYPMGGQEVLREIEGWDRGWYAGSIGVWSPERADFAVTIRCGVLEGRRLRLYVGAGMVGVPCARREWAETELKLGPWLRGTGLAP